MPGYEVGVTLDPCAKTNKGTVALNGMITTLVTVLNGNTHGSLLPGLVVPFTYGGITSVEKNITKLSQ